ncbi:MAG: hypothetical protein KF773_32170 [Deltaproteobacteria bacterium]|nr:hypothetical protein [Deltaproteobacteria bacterium]
MIPERIEALVIARAFAAAKPASAAELAAPLVRYAPPTLTEAAWRGHLERAIAELRARSVLDDRYRLVDRGQLAAAIGRHAAKTWDQLAGRTLPALGLGLAADDKLLARFEDAALWWSAVAARSLGAWTDGPPPSAPALRDAYVWRELGLLGKPKRCPGDIAAHFLARVLGSDPASFERQVRRCAAAAVGAPRQELALVKVGLVRLWCEGRALAAAGPRPFLDAVRELAGRARAGTFGERKVFIAAVWHELRRAPGYAALSLGDFKARLVAAHRAGELALARADLVAAMDPALVAASETTTDGASFHFIVRTAPEGGA